MRSEQRNCSLYLRVGTASLQNSFRRAMVGGGTLSVDLEVKSDEVMPCTRRPHGRDRMQGENCLSLGCSPCRWLMRFANRRPPYLVFEADKEHGMKLGQVKQRLQPGQVSRRACIGCQIEVSYLAPTDSRLQPPYEESGLVLVFFVVGRQRNGRSRWCRLRLYWCRARCLRPLR